MERLLRPLDAAAASGWAAALIAEFGSIGRILSENVEARSRVLDSRIAGEFLESIREAMYCTLRERAHDRPFVNNCQAVLDYLRGTQGHAGIEITRVLFLDTKSCLLKTEMLERGTVDEAAFWPRQIVKRCLELEATAVLLVHNHPSGEATPSQADIDITRRVARQCATFGITLFDHIIVTESGHASLRTQNLF